MIHQVGAARDKNLRGGEESEHSGSGTIVGPEPSLSSAPMHTSTPLNRHHRRNFTWSSDKIDEPSINVDESTNYATATAALDALPRIDLVERMEISRLFDSDTETVAGALSDPSTSDPGDASTSSLQRGSNDVNNFSTTTRKGSSLNASPMKLSRLQRDRSPINRDGQRHAESDVDEDGDDPAGESIKSSYQSYQPFRLVSSDPPAAVRRELRRLVQVLKRLLLTGEPEQGR